MTIKTEIKQGTLKTDAYLKLYDELRKINYVARCNTKSQCFKPNEEYVFIGENGVVTVTFELTDLEGN